MIASSHFLLRSGVRGPVGRRMSCNLALPVAFDMGRPIDAFDGEESAPQGRGGVSIQIDIGRWLAQR